MHHRWCYKLNMHIVYILFYKGWKKALILYKVAKRIPLLEWMFHCSQ